MANRHIPKSLFAFVSGVILFGIGLTVLHLNPYWRVEPGSGGYLNHHVYLWWGVGHLITALGLLCGCLAVVLTIVSLGSRYFTTKWLYWGGVAAVAGILVFRIAEMGISARYEARFHWESAAGVTAFAVVTGTREPQANWLWQTIVRWQIVPDLDGWLRTGHNLRSTDGDTSVTVVNLIPIAVSTALGSDGETLRNTKYQRR